MGSGVGGWDELHGSSASEVGTDDDSETTY